MVDYNFVLSIELQEESSQVSLSNGATLLIHKNKNDNHTQYSCPPN